MGSEWIDFLTGMVKPVAALAVPAVAVIFSFLQKLELEKEIPYSVARAFLQLSVVGFVLQFIFLQQNLCWILLVYLFMVSMAAYIAGQRANHVPYMSYIAGVSILSGTSFTLCLLVILNVFPLIPRYIIPILGMMVGNAMTVTGVTMRCLREDLKHQHILVRLFIHSSPL